MRVHAVLDYPLILRGWPTAKRHVVGLYARLPLLVSVFGVHLVAQAMTD